MRPFLASLAPLLAPCPFFRLYTIRRDGTTDGQYTTCGWHILVEFSSTISALCYTNPPAFEIA